MIRLMFEKDRDSYILFVRREGNEEPLDAFFKYAEIPDAYGGDECGVEIDVHTKPMSEAKVDKFIAASKVTMDAESPSVTKVTWLMPRAYPYIGLEATKAPTHRKGRHGGSSTLMTPKENEHRFDDLCGARFSTTTGLTDAHANPFGTDPGRPVHEEHSGIIYGADDEDDDDEDYNEDEGEDDDGEDEDDDEEDADDEDDDDEDDDDGDEEAEADDVEGVASRYVEGVGAAWWGAERGGEEQEGVDAFNDSGPASDAPTGGPYTYVKIRLTFEKDHDSYILFVRREGNEEPLDAFFNYADIPDAYGGDECGVDIDISPKPKSEAKVDKFITASKVTTKLDYDGPSVTKVTWLMPRAYHYVGLEAMKASTHRKGRHGGSSAMPTENEHRFDDLCGARFYSSAYCSTVEGNPFGPDPSALHRGGHATKAEDWDEEEEEEEEEEA
jgi:hypothetical protein